MRLSRPRFVSLVLLLLAGCGSDALPSGDAGVDAGPIADAPSIDVGADGAPDAGIDRPTVGMDVAPADLGTLDLPVMDSGALDLTSADLGMADQGASDTLPDASQRACTSRWGGLTEAQLMALVPATKACASDVPLICSQNVDVFAGVCGVECLGVARAEYPDCVSKCLSKRIALGEACRACYGAQTACVAVNCRNECVADPASAICQRCQIEKGCRAEFFACSGLPGSTVDAGP